MFSLTPSLLFATTAFAAVQLTAPGPGDTFYAYGNCTLAWTTDSSPASPWKNMTIDLMSGSNLNMTRVVNVASGIDGTDSSLSPFIWVCPPVNPYSAIYFYQLSAAGSDESPTWTTRFTIAAPNGHSVPPPNATQPDGEPVPWGYGALAFNETETAALESMAKGRMAGVTGPTIEGPKWHASSADQTSSTNTDKDGEEEEEAAQSQDADRDAGHTGATSTATTTISSSSSSATTASISGNATLANTSKTSSSALPTLEGGSPTRFDTGAFRPAPPPIPRPKSFDAAENHAGKRTRVFKPLLVVALTMAVRI